MLQEIHLARDRNKSIREASIQLQGVVAATFSKVHLSGTATVLNVPQRWQQRQSAQRSQSCNYDQRGVDK